MKTKKIILITVGLLVLGVAGWMLGTPGVRHDIMFNSTKVIKNDISNSVTATGTVEPVTQVEIGTQVSGIVSKLYVDYNSEVKKGQIIAELDKTNLLNDLASKKSALASAKTEYEYQQKNYDRSKTLHEKTLVSDTDYELALYNYEKARNAYDISKNDLSKAQTNLGYATITSPIDGVVLSRSVEEGQTVASSFNTPTLFIIANNLMDMQVVADVDEADIGGVHKGQRVKFNVDAYPNDRFDGQVSQVRQEATITNNVVTYQVVISAPNNDLKLKPGLTANITIYTVEKKGVLCVPSKALRFSPEPALIGSEGKVIDCKGRHKLWTQEGDTFTAHAVKTGINNGILTEIESGVTEGTVIITDAVIGHNAANVNEPSQDQPDKSPFMPSRGRSGQKKNKS